jgi:hypothetical protein
MAMKFPPRRFIPLLALTFFLFLRGHVLADEALTYAYPSPSRHTCVHLTFRSLEIGRAEVRVYNERGNMVARKADDTDPGWQTWDLGLCRLPPGVYYHQVLLRYQSGKTETLKGEPFAVLH